MASGVCQRNPVLEIVEQIVDSQLTVRDMRLARQSRSVGYEGQRGSVAASFGKAAGTSRVAPMTRTLGRLGLLLALVSSACVADAPAPSTRVSGLRTGEEVFRMF